MKHSSSKYPCRARENPKSERIFPSKHIFERPQTKKPYKKHTIEIELTLAKLTSYIYLIIPQKNTGNDETIEVDYLTYSVPIAIRVMTKNNNLKNYPKKITVVNIKIANLYESLALDINTCAPQSLKEFHFG